jgi:hypothetical protein
MGRGSATVQWGAVVSAVAVLVGLATYYDCLPVTKGQITAHSAGETEERQVVNRNMQHLDRDLKRLMEKARIEHRGEVAEIP